MKHVDLDFFSRELDKRIGKCLDGTVDVTFDDDIEFLEVADCTTTSDIFECENLCRAQALLALQLFAFRRYLAGLLFGVEDVESIASGRSAVKAEDKRRCGGSCFLDTLVTFIEHGFHFAEMVTGKHNVAYTQSSVLHKYVCHISASFVKRRFDNGTYSVTIRVGLEFEHLGFEKHLVHQLVDTCTFFG